MSPATGNHLSILQRRNRTTESLRTVAKPSNILSYLYQSENYISSHTFQYGYLVTTLAGSRGSTSHLYASENPVFLAATGSVYKKQSAFHRVVMIRDY